MELDNNCFTRRCKKILQLAATNNNGLILPHHLFMAACREGTGVCGELNAYLYKHLGSDYLHYIGGPGTEVKGAASTSILSKETSLVLEKADEKRRYYRQMFINEGHLIESILEIDDVMNECLTKELKEGIIQIACVPRDLIVRLEDFKKKGDMVYKNTIRRAAFSDLGKLRRFIKMEFGERWIKRIDNLSSGEQLPVFLAEEKGEIIGFACFDMENKGMFGPMGTSSRKRLSSVGKELLHRSLLDMAERGYAYAVIEQAGPIEFYEKACGAKLIQ